MPPFAAATAQLPPPMGGLPPSLDPAYALGGMGLPVASDAILAAMGIVPRPPGPDPSGWARLGGKPTKPKAGRVVEAATADRDWHADWHAVLMIVDDFIEQRRHGRFKRHKEDLESGELEPFFDPTLRNEHYKGVDEIASYDTLWESPSRDWVDSEESRAKGDAFAYHFELWGRQHDRDGGGDLKWAIADDGMRKGIIASAHAVDPDAETGIRSILYDPATCYPSFERGRGLARVTCVYVARVDEVIARFGVEPKVERKLKKLASEDGDYDPSYEVEVCEWWDRNWAVAVVDDVEIWSTEHGRQEVPFVVTRGNYGKQSHGNNPQTDKLFAYDTPLLGDFGVHTSNVSRRDERASESQPFCWRRLKSHVHKESFGVVLATAIRDWRKQPYVWQRSLQERHLRGRVEVDYGEEGQTDIGADAKFAPLRDPAQLQILAAPFGAMLGTADATSGLPPIAYGNMPASQTSGSAAKQMTNEGKEIYRPVARHVERHLSECAEMWARMWRDYGAAMGDPRDSPGTIKVPRRSGRGGAHEVDSELIARTGTRAACKLTDPDLLGDVARVNAAMMAMNTGLLTKWTSRKQLGADPDIEQERQDREALMEVPEIGQRRTLELHLEDIKEARDRGDQESEQVAMIKANYIAQQMFMGQLMKHGAAMAMERAGLGPANPTTPKEEAPIGPNGEEMLPGQLPTGPMADPDAPSGANFQGGAMPDFGIATGVMGGRPPLGMNPGEV